MPAKKKAVAPPPRKVKVSQPNNAQTAAERKAGEAHLRTLIEKFSPEYLRLVNATRRCLRERLPTANEVIYEYRDWFVISISPSDKGYEGVFAIRVSADGVSLHFNRGKELSDPDKLLKGSGKQTRFINLEKASTLALPAVAQLIDAAIAHNDVPFAESGRGAIICKPAKPSK